MQVWQQSLEWSMHPQATQSWRWSHLLPRNTLILLPKLLFINLVWPYVSLSHLVWIKDQQRLALQPELDDITGLTQRITLILLIKRLLHYSCFFYSNWALINAALTELHRQSSITSSAFMFVWNLPCAVKWLLGCITLMLASK